MMKLFFVNFVSYFENSFTKSINCLEPVVKSDEHMLYKVDKDGQSAKKEKGEFLQELEITGKRVAENLKMMIL